MPSYRGGEAGSSVREAYPNRTRIHPKLTESHPNTHYDIPNSSGKMISNRAWTYPNQLEAMWNRVHLFTGTWPPIWRVKTDAETFPNMNSTQTYPNHNTRKTKPSLYYKPDYEPYPNRSSNSFEHVVSSSKSNRDVLEMELNVSEPLTNTTYGREFKRHSCQIELNRLPFKLKGKARHRPPLRLLRAPETKLFSTFLTLSLSI